MKRIKFFIYTLIIFSFGFTATAQSLRLPALLSDGAVLQRGRPLPLHGWAEAGADVTVHLGRKSFKTTAAPSGRWQVTLPAQKAGGPLTLTVEI